MYEQLHGQPTDLAKNVFLEQLHDSNEVLYYKVLADHLAELLPVVYDPTMGMRSGSIPMSSAARGASSCRSISLATSRRHSRPFSSGLVMWT